MDNTEDKILEELKRLKEVRAKECIEKIQELLKEYKCELSTEIVIHINGKQVGVTINAL